ncbi:MAG: alpha/beta hydrolase, partial [Campylobacteraceae bacterium]|nr:alpha/beta hydrolase [Campylobacteraceae bacterium]
STLNRQEIYANFKNLDFPIKLFYSKNDRLFNYESINDIFYTNSKITIVSREGTSNNISLEVSKELSFEIKEWML